MQYFLVSFVSILVDLLSFAIIARILLSWIRSPGAGRLKMVLHDVTEPIMAPFRKPVFRIGMMDISPIIVLVLLDLAKTLLIYIIDYIFMAI
jgi:YggT family protein